jgi:hypothetical protein
MAKVGDGSTVTEMSPREMTRKIERYLGYLQFCIQKKRSGHESFGGDRKRGIEEPTRK